MSLCDRLLVEKGDLLDIAEQVRLNPDYRAIVHKLKKGTFATPLGEAVKRCEAFLQATPKTESRRVDAGTLRAEMDKLKEFSEYFRLHFDPFVVFTLAWEDCGRSKDNLGIVAAHVPASIPPSDHSSVGRADVASEPENIGDIGIYWFEALGIPLPKFQKKLLKQFSDIPRSPLRSFFMIVVAIFLVITLLVGPVGEAVGQTFDYIYHLFVGRTSEVSPTTVSEIIRYYKELSSYQLQIRTIFEKNKPIYKKSGDKVRIEVIELSLKELMDDMLRNLQTGKPLIGGVVDSVLKARSGMVDFNIRQFSDSYNSAENGLEVLLHCIEEGPDDTPPVGSNPAGLSRASERVSPAAPGGQPGCWDYDLRPMADVIKKLSQLRNLVL
ncbi:MAG: hypothetical protein GC191_19370 [Azospirillum sp.]|nr:hypothetical protein [Azospirillum sp.]